MDENLEMFELSLDNLASVSGGDGTDGGTPDAGSRSGERTVVVNQDCWVTLSADSKTVVDRAPGCLPVKPK